MADPLTLGTVAAVGSGIGGIVQGVGAKFSGEAQGAAYRYKAGVALLNKQINEQNANWALESGDIDVKPEYLASELSSSPLFSAADKASGDPTAEVAALKPLLAEHGITLLDTSQANDTNVFVVTKATADKYGLSKVSDLAKKT